MPIYIVKKDGKALRRVTCQPARIALQLKAGEAAELLDMTAAPDTVARPAKLRIKSMPSCAQKLDMLIAVLKAQGIDLSNYDEWLMTHYMPPKRRG